MATPGAEKPEERRDFNVAQMTHDQVREHIADPRMERFKEARKTISDLLAQKTKGLRRGRQNAEVMTSALAWELLEPITAAEDTLKALQSDAVRFGSMLSDLLKKSEPIYKRVDRLVEINTKLIEKLTFKEGKMLAQSLALLDREAKNLTKLLMDPKNEDLANSLAWAIGIPGKEGRSLEHYKPQAFDALAKEFDRKDFDSDQTATAFFTLALMNQSDRDEFLRKYLEGLSTEDKEKFLWAGNGRGAFSPQEMGKHMALDEEEVEKATKIYEYNSQFPKLVKYLLEEKGLSHHDLTFGNLIKHVLAPLIIGTTIFANVGVSIFSGGKFNKPNVIVSGIVENHNIWLAMGAKLLLDSVTGKENYINAPEEKDIALAQNIKDVMGTSKELGAFIGHPDGPAVFSGFVRRYKEADEGLIGPGTLAKYLKDQAAKSPDERDIKGADLAALQKTLGTKSLDEKKLLKLTRAFRKLNIGSGTSKIAREQLQTVLAKGKMPAKKTAPKKATT